jgi:hypothetical protein
MNPTRGNSSPLDATLLQATLHTEELTLPHPVTGEVLTITAPWPKDLKVALKYLRQFAV